MSRETRRCASSPTVAPPLLLITLCYVHLQVFAQVPQPTKEDWKKGQALFEKGYHNMGYKYKESIVLPSEKLLDEMPADKKTVADRRA